MHIELLNNTFKTAVRYLKAQFCMQLAQILVKELKIYNFIIFFIVLEFVMERLALAICHDWPNPAQVLVRYQLGCY